MNLFETLRNLRPEPRGNNMYASPTSDLAFKHILESGLRVVRHESIENTRRSNVLRALVQIFTEASRGSQAVNARNMLVAVEEPPAFERFALFFRYLDRTIGADLPARLTEATEVLSAIEQEGKLNADAERRAADLIQNMLTAISRESRLCQLSSPKEVHLSF